LPARLLSAYLRGSAISSSWSHALIAEFSHYVRRSPFAVPSRHRADRRRALDCAGRSWG